MRIYANTGVAIQPNGEHLLFERWVYELWVSGYLTDPFLSYPFTHAIQIIINW